MGDWHNYKRKALIQSPQSYSIKKGQNRQFNRMSNILSNYLFKKPRSEFKIIAHAFLNKLTERYLFKLIIK